MSKSNFGIVDDDQKKRGRFIVVEGLDGSGKTTQSDILCQRLETAGIQVHHTAECSNGPIGRVIRNDYLSGKRKADPRITNLLYAVDRLDHITNEEDGMLWKVNQGIYVVSDRYYLSSVAYYAQEFFGTSLYENQMDYIIQQNAINFELLRPDVTIFLDIPAEEAHKRISSRDRPIEIYEYVDKMRKIRSAYFRGMEVITERNGEEFIIVDASGDVQEIADRVWEATTPFLDLNS